MIIAVIICFCESWSQSPRQSDKGSVPHNRIFCSSSIARRVGNGITHPHFQPLRNPVQGQRPSAAQTPGCLHLLTSAFSPTFQLRPTPFPAPQFLRYYPLGLGRRRFLPLLAPAMLVPFFGPSAPATLSDTPHHRNASPAGLLCTFVARPVPGTVPTPSGRSPPQPVVDRLPFRGVR